MQGDQLDKSVSPEGKANIWSVLGSTGHCTEPETGFFFSQYLVSTRLYWHTVPSLKPVSSLANIWSVLGSTGTLYRA